MRTSVERYKYKNYTDFELKHLFKALVAFLWSSAGWLIVVSPLIAISFMLSTNEKEGVKVTLLYVFSVFVSTLINYVLVLLSTLNGLMFTTDKRFYYIFTEVPRLVKANRTRFFNGLAKATVVPLIIIAMYWVMVQRIPIVLPPYGVFIFTAIVSGTYALRDAYRMFRDNLTIIDSFGLLMPKKMIQSKKGKLNKVPFRAFGNGVLFAPFLQSFFLSVFALFLMVAYGEEDNFFNSIASPWIFIISYATAFTVWAITFRMIDTFKPWGERGQLSVLRHSDGSVIESRRQN